MENNKVKNFFRFNSMICKSKILRFLFFLMILMPLNQVTIYEIQAQATEEERNRITQKIQELIDLHNRIFVQNRSRISPTVKDVVVASSEYTSNISKELSRFRYLQRNRQSIGSGSLTEEEANNFKSSLNDLERKAKRLHEYYKFSQGLQTEKRNLNTALQTLEGMRKTYMDSNARSTSLVDLESMKNQSLNTIVRDIIKKNRFLQDRMRDIEKKAREIKKIAQESSRKARSNASRY